MKDCIEINCLATDWGNQTFLDICDKTGDLPKVVKDAGEGLKIVLDRGHKNGRIVSVEGGAEVGCTPPKMVEVSIFHSSLEDELQGINSDVEQKRG